MREINNELLLSINEFSKMTKVPKERLRFYEAEGLISPISKSSNGYRYYHPEQIVQIHLIVILNKLNYFSLKQIKEIINNKTLTFYNLLKYCRPVLEKQIIKTNFSKNYIETALKRSDYFLQLEYDKPHILNYLYGKTHKIPVSPNNYPFEYESMKIFSKYLKECIIKDSIILAAVSMSIELNDFLAGDYKINCYYNYDYSLSYEELLKLNTRRKTLFYQHNGNLSETKEILDKLNIYIREKNIKTEDEIFISIVANDFKGYANVNCNIRICIPIAEDTSDLNDTSYLYSKFTPEDTNPFNSIKSNYILTSGEFADLCNITKETLRFYNRKKLITPNYIAENKYKYYYSEQICLYYFIKMFQKVGCTIKEIQEIFLEKTANQREVFKNCLERYEKSLESFSHYSRMITSIMDIRDYFKDIEIADKPFITDFYEIPHKSHISDNKFNIYSKESAQNLIEMAEKYFCCEDYIYFPISFQMTADDFNSQEFTLIGHSLYDFTQYKNLEELPKRKYLCFHKVIPYNKVIDSLTMLHKYIKDNNLTIDGDIRIIITVNNIYDAFNYVFLTYFHIPII